MEKEPLNTDTLFFLGKIEEKELMNNFDKIYDQYKFIAKNKGYLGELKFVPSLEQIYIYVKVS